MFYSHTQARAKLPKKRRRIMPVEHLPRSLAVRSNAAASQLHAHQVAAAAAARTGAPAPQGPATLQAASLCAAAPPGAHSNFAYYAPGLTAAAAAAANVYSLQQTGPLAAPLGAHQHPGQPPATTVTGHTLVPRGATLDQHHSRARINLSNKDLLPDCGPPAPAPRPKPPTTVHSPPGAPPGGAPLSSGPKPPERQPPAGQPLSSPAAQEAATELRQAPTSGPGAAPEPPSTTAAQRDQHKAEGEHGGQSEAKPQPRPSTPQATPTRRRQHRERAGRQAGGELTSAWSAASCLACQAESDGQARQRGGCGPGVESGSDCAGCHWKRACRRKGCYCCACAGEPRAGRPDAASEPASPKGGLELRLPAGAPSEGAHIAHSEQSGGSPTDRKPSKAAGRVQGGEKAAESENQEGGLSTGDERRQQQLAGECGFCSLSLDRKDSSDKSTVL